MSGQNRGIYPLKSRFITELVDNIYHFQRRDY